MVRTRLTEDAGVEHPIICGAMYPCSNPELVAAAAEGGGLAILQPVSMTMVHGYDEPNLNEGLRNGIRYIRELTNKPIGFNALIEKGSEKVVELFDDPATERLMMKHIEKAERAARAELVGSGGNASTN